MSKYDIVSHDKEFELPINNELIEYYKPQFILAIHNDYIKHFDIAEGFNEVDFNYFVNGALRYTTIRQRDYLDGVGEKAYNKVIADNQVDDVNNTKPYLKDKEVFVSGDSNYRQLLPYTVFKDKEENKYYTYKRSSKVGETRLIGNASIGWGGHIDLVDVDYNPTTSIIDLSGTIFQSSLRELGEEIHLSRTITEHVLDGDIKQIFFGLLNDNSDEVGKLHLGVVMIYEVDKNVIMGVGEDELEYIGMTTPESILSNNPESWTKLILNHFNELV